MGSEMFIRDRVQRAGEGELGGAPQIVTTRLLGGGAGLEQQPFRGCLLYTSDAADERSSVDLGGRRIIKKKKR